MDSCTSMCALPCTACWSEAGTLGVGPTVARLARWPTQRWCNLRGWGRDWAAVHWVCHVLMWQTMLTWRAAIFICYMSTLQSWKAKKTLLVWALVTSPALHCCEGVPYFSQNNSFPWPPQVWVLRKANKSILNSSNVFALLTFYLLANSRLYFVSQDWQKGTWVGRKNVMVYFCFGLPSFGFQSIQQEYV